MLTRIYIQTFSVVSLENSYFALLRRHTYQLSIGLKYLSDLYVWNFPADPA